jgi:hypothetical protein
LIVNKGFNILIFRIFDFFNKHTKKIEGWLLWSWQTMVFCGPGRPWSFVVLADHGLLWSWRTTIFKLSIWQRACIKNFKTDRDQEKRTSRPWSGTSRDHKSRVAFRGPGVVSGPRILSRANYILIQRFMRKYYLMAISFL